MAMSFEELVKSEKDKDLEKKFKNVRTSLKLTLSKYINENGNGVIEKTIESFAGIDVTDKSPASLSKKNFLDDLLEIGRLMDDTFNKIGDSTEATLVHKLTAVSGIYMDRIGHACSEAKLNRFPMHKEKFAMDVSEEQEAKSIVPRMAFRSIKMFIDKYYYLLRQASVNPKVKTVFNKISEFRDKLLNFEWSLGNYVGKLEGEYAKEIGSFFKDTKLALLRLRKLCEAIDSSPFGKLVKTLQEVSKEMGIRAYLKYNPIVTVAEGSVKKGSVIPLQTIIDKYDVFMEPIRHAVADYDKARRAMQQRSFLSETPKMFWDISAQITEFRDGMHLIIDEFSKGISQSNEDFKYFIYTVQNVLIPYMNQTKGEVNESFVVGVNNLDTFFWKMMVMSIQAGQEAGESIEEIMGTTVKITKADVDSRTASMSSTSTIEESFVTE